MEKFIGLQRWLIAAFLLSAVPAISDTPDSTGLPGDHLDLRATLELFKNSKTLEEFEKKLNTKDQHVNNLDLNADGKVDYIRVCDITNGDAHAVVLQAPVNEKESQDVAVIEIEKRGKDKAIIQIRGDEELYGENYVVEPKPDKKDSTDGKFRRFGNASQVVFVNVWYWPCVQYMYYPGYVVWVSPWYWAYYPWWWDPWYPYPYFTYYSWTVIYYDYYYCCAPAYVLTQAHTLYEPRRVVSQSVQNRYAAAQAAHREEMKKNPGGRVPGAPQPAGNPQRTEPVQRRDDVKPRGDVQPQPAPQPAPRPQPQPVPQPRPRVEPRPPRVTPAPTPAPRSPRPRFIDRFIR